MVATTPMIGLWLAGVVAATLSVLAWRERPTPGATPLSIAMGAATWWIIASAAGMAASTEAYRIAWANAEWIGILVLPVAWLWFCIEYTGRTHLLTARNAAIVSVIPAGSLVLVWTDGVFHRLFRQSVETVSVSGGSLLSVTPGPGYWVATGYAYLLTVAGMLLLAELWFGNRTAYRIQVSVLIAAALIPAVVEIVVITELVEVTRVNPTPIAFLASATLVVGAVSRFGLFESAPIPHRVARSEVVEGMDDGVLVVDSSGHIVDANAKGAAVVGASTTEAIGLPAAECVPGYADAVESDTSTVTVSYQRGGNERYLDVRVTPFDGETPDGAVIVLRDVTEDRRREQRLDVLNRVLRHNLRNDLNVVYGYAEYLGGQETYDEEAVEKIKTRSQSLMSIGDKAREVEQFLGRDDPEPVDVAPLLNHEVQRLRERYENASVIVESFPEGTRCAGTIGPVVRDLLENAVKHNDSDTPIVRIDATRHGGELVIRVTDNGPGLPEEERAVLENGRETPLEHGSGLGLWLVVWGVREMKGTVDFETPEDGGSTVTVRVPATDSLSDSEADLSSTGGSEATNSTDPGEETPIAGPD